MPPLPTHAAIRCRDRLLPLHDRVLLMGVLNLTPDSFSDGGVYADPAPAVERAVQMVEEGADILDLGAESTRPGADPVDEAEEWRRLGPVLKAVARRVSIPISVDTMKAGIAERAVDAGAAIINDVSALQADPRMAAVAAAAGAGVILMHMPGTPRTMQDLAEYEDVVGDVRDFLVGRLEAAERAGIARDRIALDPGIGFGKHRRHNLSLLAHLDVLTALGRPVVVGVSRKAFLGQLTGRAVGERTMGTAAAVALAVHHGARIVRVHEVGAMRDVVRVAEAITAAAEPVSEPAPRAY